MLNEEMITKAKEAKSVEELIALAKENGVELNEEDAKMYFEQLNAKKGELSDDELDAVAGGGCETKVDGKTYTVGALLLTNFGRKNQFVICGKKAGEEAHAAEEDYFSRDTGSCMMILATDLPLSSRQLKRCAHRAQNGLARCGAQTGGGSGEIVIAFSTANRVPHDGAETVHTAQYLHEDLLDTVFTAVADCVEESVVSSVFHAETVTGRDGNTLEAFFAGI